MERRDRIAVAELLVACGIVTVGLLFLIGTLSIDDAGGGGLIGPRFFPWLVSGGLIVTGAVLILEAYRGRPEQTVVSPTGKPRYFAFAYISLGLLLQMLLIQSFGFVIAAVALFVCSARAFGARNWVVVPLIGLALAVVTYTGFRYGLEINLPGAFSGLR